MTRYKNPIELNNTLHAHIIEYVTTAKTWATPSATCIHYDDWNHHTCKIFTKTEFHCELFEEELKQLF